MSISCITLETIYSIQCQKYLEKKKHQIGDYNSGLCICGHLLSILYRNYKCVPTFTVVIGIHSYIQIHSHTHIHMQTYTHTYIYYILTNNYICMYLVHSKSINFTIYLNASQYESIGAS